MSNIFIKKLAFPSMEETSCALLNAWTRRRFESNWEVARNETAECGDSLVFQVCSCVRRGKKTSLRYRRFPSSWKGMIGSPIVFSGCLQIRWPVDRTSFHSLKSAMEHFSTSCVQRSRYRINPATFRFTSPYLNETGHPWESSHRTTPFPSDDLSDRTT